MHGVSYYVHRINKKNPKVKYIHLTNRKLTDEDIAPLFEAFKNNPDVAARIREIHLSGNKLKVLHLEGFINLRKLHVAHNHLYELVLRNLPSITHLYASNNRLHTIEIYHLYTLQVVSLAQNSLVSANINHLESLRKFGITNNHLTSVGKSALKAVNIQERGLKVLVSDNSEQKSILQIKLPKVNDTLLRIHFETFCYNLFPNEVKSNIFAITHTLFSVSNRSIPTETIAHILDFIIPSNYSLALEREIQNLRVAFTRRPEQMLRVNQPPSRNMPALHILNAYTINKEFTPLRNRATRPLVFIAEKYCAGIKKLQDSKKALQDPQKVIEPATISRKPSIG